jgi:cholesterol transport system auxiliary component
MRSLASILFVVALLCGCASSPRWTRQTFAFSLPSDPPATIPNTNLVTLRRLSVSPLFQSRSFTYRTAENSYEHDPYAGFLIPPEQALAQSIRASMRASSVFGRLLPPGSNLAPSLVAEVSVTQLYGDLRNRSQPVGTLELHFICYEVTDGAPGRIVLDKVCTHETRMAARTPDALMTAWNTDLGEIMEQINSAYIKASSTTH